jgi:hypothetical protein
MTLVYPEGTPTLGNTKVAACLTVADLTEPSLATEINAVTSVDGSLHLYPAGWAPTGTPAKGEKPPRLGSKKTLQQFNRTAYDLGDLQYVYDPQGDPSAPSNELMEILVPGTKRVLVERIGLDAEDVAFAVGQKVRCHYVELNDQIPSGDRTDENGEHFITQSVIYVNDGPVDGVIAA